MKKSIILKDKTFAEETLASYKNSGTEASLTKNEDGTFTLEYDLAGYPEETDSVTQEQMYSSLKYCYEYMDRRYSDMLRQLDYLWKEMRDHERGHLPAITSSAQMKTAIENLGLSDEYQVQPRIVYASTKSGGFEAKVSLPKNK